MTRNSVNSWISTSEQMVRPEIDHPMAATIDDEFVGLAWAKIRR